MPVRLFYIGCQTEALLWFLVLDCKKEAVADEFQCCGSFFCKKASLTKQHVPYGTAGGKYDTSFETFGKNSCWKKNR